MPSVAIIGTRGYPSYYGGFETAIRHLAPHLASNGWDVAVYGRRGTTHRDDHGADARVRRIETWGVETKQLSTLTFGLSASIHAMRTRPDVALVMNCANGYWLPLLRARGIPTVVNVDGIEWERAKWGRVARKVFHTGAQFTARFATELVFDSHEIARRWADDFSRQGTYIPYGGDTSPHALPLVDGLEHRGYVLLVARFVPENTINEFFDAVPQLSEMADVVIVGSSGYGGELDARASELARRLDRVHWMGHLSDDRRLYSLWQHAGAYVHGHSVGGTNPALVQAMALGAPVVARDTVFNREVLGPDAAYFQPNADSIVKTVKSSFQDRSDIERRSHSHISRAEQNFSWEKINSDYASCLYAAIGRRLGETK